MEEILHKMAQQRQHLTDLATNRERLLQQRETVLRSKTSAAELLLLGGQMQAIKDMEASGRKQLVQLEEQRQTQMKVYETAHQNREILARMREQQVEQFKRVQARKEQMQMDDIFSCRRTSA
ncbi:MAG: flagellar FliJ family protein [Janthinobacterium lividum]